MFIPMARGWRETAVVSGRRMVVVVGRSILGEWVSTELWVALKTG